MNSANAMKSIFLTATILVCAVGCGLWPGGSDVPSDPIEFAIHMATLGSEENWEEMRSLMVEEFRDFDLDALEWAVNFQSISPELQGPFQIMKTLTAGARSHLGKPSSSSRSISRRSPSRCERAATAA